MPFDLADQGLVIDWFAGPGGVDEGLRRLDPAVHARTVGIELEPWACATRRAAGHHTIRGDVTKVPVGHLRGRVWGCWFSPPCPTWSAAGKRAGHTIIEDVADLVTAELAGERDWEAQAALWRGLLGDDGVAAALSAWPARIITELAPRWVAMEQVPPALPLWERYAWGLRQLGYSTWCGVLNSADYGVPQTRDRAFLIASLDVQVRPPEPTHCDQRTSPSLFLEPWVSMADALGWPTTWEATGMRGAGMLERHGDRPGHPASGPAPTLRANGGGNASPGWIVRTNCSTKGGTRPGGLSRGADEPARTIDSAVGSWTVNTGRDWEPGGDRSTAQKRPVSEPSPTLGAQAKAWHFDPPADGSGGLDGTPAPDMPVPVLVSIAGGGIVLADEAGEVFAVRTLRPVRELAMAGAGAAAGAMAGAVLVSGQSVAGGPLAERDVDEPAFTVTTRADQWIVRTGTSSMKHSRRMEDLVLYERPLDRPAPTLDAKVGSAWKIMLNPGMTATQPNRRLYDPDAEPAPTVAFGHDAANWRWQQTEVTGPVESVRTSFGEPHRGAEAGSPVPEFDPNTRPSRTVTTKAGDWVLESRRDSAARVEEHGPRENRAGDEPAPTMTGEAFRWAWGDRWSNGEADDPSWPTGRPSTTVAGDPRIAQPGHKVNAGDEPGPDGERPPGRMAGSIRITSAEAAVLQSFPPDYPFQGTKTAVFKAIGNAVPCVMAAYVAAAAMGRTCTPEQAHGRRRP